MPRNPRIVLPGVPHHAWTRGNNRRRLFSFTPDYECFLWLMSTGLDRFPCHLHAFALMANHVHMLVTPDDPDALSGFFKYVCQRYAQLRNARRDGSGKLFEQSYDSKPVKDLTQLAITTMYIDANPVAAGAVATADRYRWSSYATHAGSPTPPVFRSERFTPSAWYLGLGVTPEERAAAYRTALDEYLRRAEQKPAHWKSSSLPVLEARCSTPYGKRLRRPNQSRASER
jgi:putative transposase